MASMADDQQNPFTMMGMMNMMQPNKYSLPQYKGGLQLQGFRGPATDARGNVIQSFADAQAQHDAWDKANPAAPAQGTTLNSVGAGLEPAGSPARAMQNAGYGDWAMLDPTLAASRQGAMGGEGSVAATSGWNPVNPMSKTGVAPGAAGATGTASGAGGTASGAGGTNPVDMRQAYLDALANPGHVTTPGAAIPASQPVGSPSVLDAFLSQNKGSSGGAGGYSNEGFFNTLNKLRSA
jgi:hypothetical protein